MKSKLVKLLIVLVLIFGNGYASVNALIDLPSLEGGGSGSSTTLQLNVPYDVTLTYNVAATFVINLTSTQKYYVVETWGDADTKLVISGGLYGTNIVTDYNSGDGNNAYVEFLSWGTEESPSTISIVLSLETNCEVKDTTIIVREEAASLYGFNFGLEDGSTANQIKKAYEVLSPHYVATKYINERKSHLYGEDFRGIPRMNSEVFVIASHGTSFPGGIAGRGMLFYNNTEFEFVEYISSPTPYVKFAVFAGCSTAADNCVDANLASEAHIMGEVKCSFGFTHNVMMISVLKYMNNMFKKIGEGKTIADATEYAAARGYFFSNDSKRYRLYGDSSIILVPTSTAPRSISSSFDNALYNEFFGRQLGFVFNNEEITGHYSGSCLTYNGYQTSDYYIMQYDDDGNMIGIEHSGNYFDDSNVLPIVITSTPTPSVGDDGSNQYLSLDSVETKIIYHTMNGVSIPIEFKYCTYSNSSTNHVFKTVYCTNLYSGESIDPDDLMSI